MARPVDWAAEERKLQPVYEDIQFGLFKRAKDTVERWLKKHPKSQPALVLRMVIAEKQRLGAPAVLRAYADVKRTEPLSGRSVWFVALALRNIRRPDLVLELYQGIWDSRPDIAELGDQVFLTASAMGNTAVMSTSSRKLFNATKAPQWARLAAYSAWAHAAPPPSDADPFPLAPARSLLPASLLLRTTGKEVATADQLWLRLEVALGNGDVAEARRLVKDEGRKGSLNRRWIGMEAAKAIAGREGVDSAEVWADEFAATVAQLADPESQYNYAFYRHLLAALDGAYTAERAGEADDLFKQIAEAIGAKERAPSLARLELDKRQRARNAGMDKAEWEALVKAYLARWGSKWTTGDELAGIAGEDRNDEMLALVSANLAPHTNEKSYLTRAVAELYLLQHGEKKGAAHYWTLYTEGLQYGVNLPKTDVQPADFLGLAAVDVLLASWAQKPEDDGPLLAAASALEHIIAKSPSSFDARFTLARVYRLLAAPGAYVPHLAKLNLSEIQLDNLLHVVSERGGVEARAGGKDVAKAWSDIVEKASLMYTRGATDLPEYIKQALEQESYSKVHGIRTLVKCLDSSIAARALEVEEVALALATGADVSDSTLETLSAGLADDTAFIDNRNFELLADSLSPSGAALSAAQPTIDEKAIRALGAVTLRAARFVKGEPVDAASAAVDTAGLQPVDTAYVSALDTVLRATVESTTPPSLAGVYDPLLALATSPAAAEGTTYARTHALLTLAQLARTFDSIYKRVADLAKPVKGKKRPAHLVAFLAELKGAREALKTANPDQSVAAVLRAPSAQDMEAARAWADAELVQSVQDSVAAARKELGAGLDKWLGSGSV